MRKEHEGMTKRHSIWILITFLLLLTSCNSPAQNVVSVSTKLPTNGPTATTTPIPPIPTVGSIPRNCPTSNPTHQVFSQLAPVTGSTPVWATWSPGPGVFREGPVTSSNPPTNYDPAYGWMITKIVWEVGPNYTHPIAIHGYGLTNHAPVLIQVGNDTPTANVVLDPRNPEHPRSVLGDGWAEWGSYLVIPKAGCYGLDVSWPTGHWTLTFAFGA